MGRGTRPQGLSLRQKYSRESTPPANPHMKRLPQGYDAPFLALKPLFWGLWPILSHHAGSEGDLFSEQQVMRGNASFRTSFALAFSLEVSAQTPRISIFLTKRQRRVGEGRATKTAFPPTHVLSLCDNRLIYF